MKKLVIAGLLITTLLLVFISGCKPVGKAIQIPSSSPTNIADFPNQFITSTDSTIGYSSTTIFAPTAYSTEVTDLMNFMRQKACQLLPQGLNCVDTSGNLIPTAGAAVFSLTGMSVAGQTAEAKIYACRRGPFEHIDYDHYIEKNTCEHTTQKVLGRVLTTQPATGDTVQLTLCKKTNAPYRDDQVVGENGCGTNEDLMNYIGYAYKTQPTGIATSAITTCSFNSNGEQFVTEGTGCPSGSNNLVTYWVLPFCEDSDNGKNTNTAGGAYSHIDKTNYTDYCSGSNVVEYYCDAQTTPFGVKSETLQCPQGYPCTNGACTAEYNLDIHKNVEYNREKQEANYTITVDNNGAEISGVPSVILQDYVPAGLTIKSITPEPTNITGNSLEWRFNKFDNKQGDTHYDSRSDTKVYDSGGRFIVNIIAEVNEAILAPGTDVTNKANVSIGTLYLEESDKFSVQQRPAVELTKPVYRCWSQSQIVVWDKLGLTKVVDVKVTDHYLSFDSNCEGNNVDGLVGYVYKEQQQNTVEIIQCYRQTSYHNHVPRDHFLAYGPDCPQDTYDRTTIGYIPASATSDTKTIYRCWNTDSISEGKFDHMVSESLNCEGYNNEGLTFNFLTHPVTTQPGPPAPTISGPGGVCTQTSNCQSGYECIEGICTRKVPIYSCDRTFLDTSTTCGITGNSASSVVQIGYVLDSSVANVPGTILYGICTDASTGAYTFGLQSSPSTIPCPGGYGFNALGYVFTTQKTGTVGLRMCSDYSNSYYVLFGNESCPTTYPVTGPSNIFIYPAPFCGDGIVQSPPEQCELPNTQMSPTVNCSSTCQNITIIPPQPPANITNVTNYTYVPPPNTIPPIGPPITLTTNYIALGTCIDNPIIYDSTYGLGMSVCSNLMPGEAIIQIKTPAQGITGLIIAGGSPADVNAAVQVIKNLTKWNAEGSVLEITNNAYLTTVGRLSLAFGGWRYNLEYHLPAGIHFIGVPFTLASKTIANIPALNATGGIFAYDATNNRSVLFDVDWPASPPLLSDLTIFGKDLEAYYVKMNTAGNFMLRDATKATTAPIRNIPAAGWVAYTAYGKQKTISQIVPTGIVVNSLYCYENNQFVQKNLALNPTIDVGQGCWINLGSGATLQ